MPLLRYIRIESEKLVGILDSGEKIPLSAPQLGIYPSRTENSEFARNRFRAMANKERDFYQEGPAVKTGNSTWSVAYNRFEKIN